MDDTEQYATEFGRMGGKASFARRTKEENERRAKIMRDARALKRAEKLKIEREQNQIASI